MFYDDEEINFYEDQEIKIKEFIGLSKYEEIYKDEIKLGDKIVINFYPDSQKYIYMLYSKYGEIIKIEDKDEYNLFSIILKNDTTEYNAFHLGVGLYGRGFEYRIIKLI